MNFDKYTERARGFVQAAQDLARRESHQQLMPEHLLKVLIDDEEGPLKKAHYIFFPSLTWKGREQGALFLTYMPGPTHGGVDANSTWQLQYIRTVSILSKTKMVKSSSPNTTR